MTHRDLVVQVGALREPASSMAALLTEWVPSHANGSQLVLRVTDDTCVDVPTLLVAVNAWTTAPSTPYLIGRVSKGSRRQLASCAYMTQPQVFQRLQPAFADEILSKEEGPLLTVLATKAGVALFHAEWIGPCDDNGSAYLAYLKTGNTSLEHVTMRDLSPHMMKDLHHSIWGKDAPQLSR